MAKLREDILRANGLVREANNFAEELGQQTRFSVTLQIPPQNLSPNRKVILFAIPTSSLLLVLYTICIARCNLLLNGEFGQQTRFSVMPPQNISPSRNGILLPKLF